MPLVTVVIPAYNPGVFLTRALASVMKQTFPDWECVVVDDGGVESLEWLDRYHPRLSRHRQDNRGVSIARNEALLHSSAELVAFLDQDDEWLPQKLKRQLASLGNADLSYTAFVWMLPDGDERANAAPQIDYHQFLREGHICLSSLLVTRSALTRVGGFNQLLRVQQDYDLVLRLLSMGVKAQPVDEVLTRCHLHRKNASADYEQALSERLHVLESHRKYGEQRRDEASVAAAREGQSVSRHLYAGQAFSNFRKDHSLLHLRRALVWSPAATSRELGRAAVRHRR